MLCLHAIPARALDVLKSLMACSACDRFDLGGGTALALHLGHRISIDLDLFTKEAFDPEELLAALPQVGSREVLGTAGNSLNLRLNDVKVDFLRHAYPRLRPARAEDGIRLLDIPDIAAMKLSTATNRGARKDFFDLAALLEIHELPRLLDWYADKFPNYDLFPVIRSLTWFVDAEEEPDPLLLSSLRWEEVKERLTRAVAAL